LIGFVLHINIIFMLTVFWTWTINLEDVPFPRFAFRCVFSFIIA